MSFCPNCPGLQTRLSEAEAETKLLRVQLKDAQDEMREFEKEARRDITNAVAEALAQAAEESGGGAW